MQKVDYSDNLYLEQFTTLSWLLYQETNFYQTTPDTHGASLQRVHYFKNIIEEGGGYRYLYDRNDDQIKTENDLNILFSLIWYGVDFGIDRSVSGPQLTKQRTDSSTVEFKLASNNQITKSFTKYIEEKQSSNGSVNTIKVIFCFSESELIKLRGMLKMLNLQNEENIVLIDARKERPVNTVDSVDPRSARTDGTTGSKERKMSSKTKILFIAANPSDTTQLKLDEESRVIDQGLRQADDRDKFDIQQQWAVRVSELQGIILRHKPNIVHFSGHGSRTSEIILQDKLGNSQAVSIRALSNLFSILKGDIQCVVLNACYSEKQAQEIAKHIDHVVGMSKAIGDIAAISFATAFYQALGYGKDYETAFKLGCSQIDLENLKEQDTPQLIVNGVHVANV